MPFAGFENFDACVAAQRSRGKSEESARKICGALQARFEKSKGLDEQGEVLNQMVESLEENLNHE